MAKDKAAKDVPPAAPARKQQDPETRAGPPINLSIKDSLSSGSKSTKCLKILFVILSILTILICIAAIAVSVMSAVTTKVYTSDQSGRVVGQVILTVTAAVTLSIIIYAVIGILLKKYRPLHAAAVVLVILALIQAIILGVSVKVSAREEDQIGLSILDSFKSTREGDQKQIKRWDTTQNTFQCCGVFSPLDYRNPNLPGYFPPNVPVSCCPGYDLNRPSSTQERELQVCKAKKEYFAQGCSTYIISAVVGTAKIVLIVVIVLIVLEITLVIVAGVLARKQKQNPEN